MPEIDIVQFRVNHESGVGTQMSAEDFWMQCTDAMIAHAHARGLQVEVPTKYWCEHATLPYLISAMRSEELKQLDNFNHSRR